MNRELFIYSWAPFQIGEIDYISQESEISSSPLRAENPFSIIITHDYTSKIPYFHKIRGSAKLVELPDCFIGVIHYSESCSPRNYFHLLVSIDKFTLKPMKYSSPFYFEKPLIEFCIGFSIRDGKYLFWISRFDRDPMFVSVEISQIPINLSF